MPDLPRGTVTFLFTDVESSTRLWQEHSDAMAGAMNRHDTLLSGSVEAHGGVVFKTMGDAVCAAFPTAPAAVGAALEAQRMLLGESWGAVGSLRVRMALHTGQAEPQDNDYRGQVLNRLARLLSAAHGGQVLLSLPTAELVRDALPAGATLRDLGELPLKDLDRLERALQLLHPDLPAMFPPVRIPVAPSHNLPLPPTPFLGREAEVAQVVALLRDPTVRLLTLTGPGGVGKTRLALRVAADLLEAFPDGVWFVGLAPITDPALVVPTVARVLGVREVGDDLLVDRVGAALRDKRLLLLLDNVEQVVEAAPRVADVLAACPGLTVLVTSRVRLRLSGEREIGVAPLGLPPSDGSRTLELVAASEAVELFAARAQATRPDFALTQDNAETVAQICRRLDGLPLALELAAARVKVFPPPALLARLERRLPLLTGGGRDLPVRQQTMRAAISWSYDLLTAPEQILFRRLAVFAGGATLDAIEAVTNPDGALDAVEGVSSLVDKSLLRQEAGPDGEPRYRMLETVREFGLERLAASGEEEDTRTAHAHHFAAFAAVGTLHVFFDPPVGRLDRMEAEHDNLRAALGWTLERGQTEVALRLAVALWPFWDMRSHISEGRGWLERALVLSDAAPAELRADALLGASWRAGQQFDGAAAVALAEQGLRDFQSLGDEAGTARARLALASAVGDHGDWKDAVPMFEEALAAFRALGDTGSVALTLNVLAAGFYDQGEFDRVASLLEEALALLRGMGTPLFTLHPLNNLGVIALEHGDHAQAAALLRESLVLATAYGNTRSVAPTLANLPEVATKSGQGERAVRLFGAAEALWEPIAMPIPADDRTYYDRLVDQAREGMDEATFAASWRAGRTLSREKIITEVDALVDEATLMPAEHDAPGGTDVLPVFGLSPRELEVVRLIAKGNSNQDIADALCISHRTASTNVRNILTKLSLDNRAAAAAWATRHHLA